MFRKLVPASGASRPPWSQDDLAALRDHLKNGTSLIDTARALDRDPDDVEGKIAELYQPGQRLLTHPPRSEV